MLTAGGSVQTEVTKEAVIETLKEFQEVRDSRPITAEELDGAKAGLLLGYPASFERPGLVLNHLLQLVLFDLPDDYFQEMPARLSGVNLSEVHRMTSEHIQTDALQIIVVGDRETIELGITAAETGHLVFGTLHTSSAPKTVDRIIDVFPADQQEQIRAMLGESLKGVIAQVLLKTKDGKGRRAALEIMVGTSAIANLIRENKIHQIPSMIQTGKKDGMQLPD